MRNSSLSHDDVTALLNGTAPAGRADLEPVAAFVDDLRLTSFESAPRPSAELLARLDSASWISPAVGGLPPATDRGAVRTTAAPAPQRGIRMVFTWFTGLGVAAKVGIGATVFALGAVGAGAANALPEPVQVGFNTVVSTLTDDGSTAVEDDSTEDATVVEDTTTDDSTVDDTTTEDTATDDTATDDTTTVDPAPVVDDTTTTTDSNKTAHAQAVTEAAHDKTTVGREHGEAVSAAAHSNKGKDDSAEVEVGDDDSTTEVEVGDDNGSDDSVSVSTDSGSGSSNSGKGSSNSGKGKH